MSADDDRCVRPAARRRTAAPDAAGAGRARGADGAAQRRAAAAHRRHPGPGPRRVRQRRGDGPRRPGGSGSTSSCPACWRSRSCRRRSPGWPSAPGFERRYGALKRLGATPLPRGGLLAAKGLSVLTIEALQVPLLSRGRVRAGLGARAGPCLAALLLVLAGTAAFAALGLLMAGTLRAEATLAAANLVYLLLLVSGGIAVPLDRFPEGARPFLEALPSGRPRGGAARRAARRRGAAARAAASCCSCGRRPQAVLAARTFRWE